MSKRDISLYIVDTLIAIDKIKRYTAKYDDAEGLLASEEGWDATIRELEIVGEATKKLLAEGLLSPKYRRIVDFRNQINHAYFGIDEQIVWDVVTDKILAYEHDLIEIIGHHRIDLSHAIDMVAKERQTSEKTKRFLARLRAELSAI